MPELPPFATDQDLEDAKEVVKKLLKKKGYTELSEDRIEKESLALLVIIYAKGGSYTKDMYLTFGETLFKHFKTD